MIEIMQRWIEISETGDNKTELHSNVNINRKRVWHARIKNYAKGIYIEVIHKDSCTEALCEAIEKYNAL